MASTSSLALIIAAAFVLACTGEVKGPGSSNDPNGPNGPDGSSGNGSGTGGGGTSTGPMTPPGLTVGTTILHRLTRAEYVNTIRDLLGSSLASLDTLPADQGGYGFSKISQFQTAAPIHVQAYNAAAIEVIEGAFNNPSLKAKLVTCDLSAGAACIKSTLEAFLPKAWRRPVDATEVDRLVALADTEAKAGGSAEEQLKVALRGALLSPKFLYLIEKDPDPASTVPHKLSGYELVNRLSYFLWSSMPDAELTSLAAQGQIDDDAALAQQVARMLADPGKGPALTSTFAAEWAELEAFQRDRTADATLFPTVNDTLKRSMTQQTTVFFQDLVTSGGPISNLVASDYTFVDGGLAKLYELPTPQGSGFVKTSLTGTTRIGGILGQSSFLMHFANEVRSSAVKRGAWLLNNLICYTIPPPPADVAAATKAQEEDPDFVARSATQTGRERLAEHSGGKPACAGCHDYIDPIGLALESYDAVGQYRTMDVGKQIDASGQLKAGDPSTAFTDVFGMAALLAKDERVAGCMAQRLATFGLTRTLDSTEVDYLNRLPSGNTDSLTSVMTKVVTSTPFRSKRGAGL